MRLRTRVAVLATSVLTVVAVGAASALPSAQAAEASVPGVDAIVTAQATIVPSPLDPMGRSAPVDAHIATQPSRQQRIAELRARIVALAKKQLGDRYGAGMSGPNAFDCSGFTRYVYKQVTGKDLPHSSRVQYTVVTRIRLRQAKPGDLIFFLANGAHHVGIYLGNGRMVDAAGPGKGVRISPVSGDWWSRSYTGVGRVLPA
ncbi:MAG: C40 family peptidase [Candidatus Nanopelagicales bacterium]